MLTLKMAVSTLVLGVTCFLHLARPTEGTRFWLSGRARVPRNPAAERVRRQDSGRNQDPGETLGRYLGRRHGDPEECRLLRRSGRIGCQDKDRSLPHCSSHGFRAVEGWVGCSQGLLDGMVLPCPKRLRPGPAVRTSATCEPDLERRGAVSRSELEGLQAVSGKRLRSRVGRSRHSNRDHFESPSADERCGDRERY